MGVGLRRSWFRPTVSAIRRQEMSGLDICSEYPAGSPSLVKIRLSKVPLPHWQLAAKMDNFHELQSVEEFRTLMSADLGRVSALNFWAPWAEPCKSMNEVFYELAKKYPKVLFLQIEAEGLPDVTESFEVESVPAFILLRGHTLLSRISGADAVGLSNALAIHANTVPKPLSRTEQKPAAATYEGEKEETQEELNVRLLKLMNRDKVVLFMKGSPEQPQCGFSRKMVALLQKEGAKFDSFDILKDDSVRQGLKTLNQWPTYPQLIIKGEFVGGLDVVSEMAENGELSELLV